MLQVDFGLTDRRARDEPTGEVLALDPDKLKGIKMGDKFHRTKPKKTDEEKRFQFLKICWLILPLGKESKKNLLMEDVL